MNRAFVIFQAAAAAWIVSPRSCNTSSGMGRSMYVLMLLLSLTTFIRVSVRISIIEITIYTF